MVIDTVHVLCQLFGAVLGNELHRGVPEMNKKNVQTSIILNWKSETEPSKYSFHFSHINFVF